MTPSPKKGMQYIFWLLGYSVLLTLFLSFHYHAEFTHFNAEKSLIRGVFEPQKCHAKLAIFVPIDSTDLRAVIVPEAGVAHNHPSFPRMKVPCAVRMKYANAVEIFGPIAATTLRVDKGKFLNGLPVYLLMIAAAVSTRSLLGGKLPQELHESMISDCVRRNIVKGVKRESAPSGFDLGGTLHDTSTDVVF